MRSKKLRERNFAQNLFPPNVKTMAKRALTVLDGGMGHQLKAMGVVIEGAVGAQVRMEEVNLKKPSQQRRNGATA